MAYKFQEGLAKLDGAISGSGIIVAKTSFSGSGDVAVTGAVHAAQFYGGGAGISGVTAGPAGSDTQLQYNNGSSMGATSTVTFNDSTLVLSLTRTGSFASITCTGSISGSHELEVAGNIESTYGSIEAGSSFIIGSADLNEADMEKLDGITNGTAAAAKAVVLDASKNIATIGTVGCGAITSTGNSSFAQGTFSGRLISDDTTEATSTTDGSLQTDGGLSVAKSAVIGDDLDLLSNGAILNIGSDEKWTATHANANDTLTVTSGHRLAFGDAGEYISGDGTDLKIVSSGDIDMTGDLDVVGTMSCDTSITLDSTTITTAEIGVLDGVTAGAGAASKALVLDASADIASGLRSVTGSGDVKFANGHFTGGIFTAGSDTIGSDGQDEVTINSIAAFQNGWELNITASGGAMDLTDAGALIVLCTGSGAQTVTLQGSQVPNDGYAIVVKSTNSAIRNVTITGSSTGNVYDAYTIDGETSLVLESPYAAVNLLWSATNGGWSVY